MNNKINYDSNVKWYDLIEKKIFENSYDYESDDNSDNEINLNNISFSLENEQILTEINNIIDDDKITTYNSLEILKKQDLVSSYLSKSMQNNNINKVFLIKLLNWICITSKELATRINMPIFNHDKSNIQVDRIIRSSYKFCNFKHTCNYNYDNKKKGCYADHYVHNMVYADLNALLVCIEMYYKDQEIIQNKEFIKCVNTISFVIKHMYEELNNLCLYINKDEYEKFHVIKNTSFCQNKKNIKRNKEI